MFGPPRIETILTIVSPSGLLPRDPPTAMDPADMFKRLKDARSKADAHIAVRKYLELCERQASAPVRIVEKDGQRIIVANGDIPENTIVTTFPPDIMIYRDDGDSHFAVDTRPPEEALEDSSVNFAARHMKIPTFGFPPLVAIVSDPSSKTITPQSAAALVGEVVQENPYAAVLGICSQPVKTVELTGSEGAGPTWSEDTVPAIAEVTAALIDRIATMSNVRIACQKSAPTVLLSVRPIADDEQIMTGHRPIYWMGDDAVMAEAVYKELIGKKAAKEGTKPKNDNYLRVQIGLPPHL